MGQFVGHGGDEPHGISRLGPFNPDRVLFRVVLPLFVQSQGRAPVVGDVLRGAASAEQFEADGLPADSHLIADAMENPCNVFVGAVIVLGKVAIGRRKDLDRLQVFEAETVDEPLHAQLDPRLFAGVERTAR